MPLATELELPSLDHTDPSLRGDALPRRRWPAFEGHDGWLAANPFGFTVLDRESGEFFLRTKDAVFPGLTIAELFRIDDGPLHEEIVKNIININGDDHRRLRNLVNPALAPRAVDRYRPAMRGFLEQLLDALPADGRCEFIADFAKPYPSLVIAEVMGAPLTDAPRLHHWSNWIQRQFDAQSLMTERELIEQAVAEFYDYEDELIARAARPSGRRPDLRPDRGRGGGRPAQRRRAAQPRPQHPRRRRRHQPEPARARGAAAGRTPRPVGAAARRTRTASRCPRSRRRCATSRSRRSRRGSRSTRSSIAASPSRRHGRARLGLARQPRGVEPDGFDITADAAARAGADLRRRHPLLRRRQPRPRRDAGGARLPRRARAFDRASTASPSSARPRGSTASERLPLALELRASAVGFQSASSPSGWRTATPVRRARSAPRSAAARSGASLPRGHQHRDLLRGQPLSESARAAAPASPAAAGASSAGRCWRPARRRPRPAEIRRPPGACRSLEHDRRRREAHRAVGGRRLALELGRRAGGRARLGAVALVGLGHLGRVELAPTISAASTPGTLRSARLELALVLEHQRRGEVRQLQRPERPSTRSRARRGGRRRSPGRPAPWRSAAAWAPARTASRSGGSDRLPERSAAAACSPEPRTDRADSVRPITTSRQSQLRAVAPAQHRAGRGSPSRPRDRPGRCRASLDHGLDARLRRVQRQLLDASSICARPLPGPRVSGASAAAR